MLHTFEVALMTARFSRKISPNFMHLVFKRFWKEPCIYSIFVGLLHCTLAIGKLANVFDIVVDVYNYMEVHSYNYLRIKNLLSISVNASE